MMGWMFLNFQHKEERKRARKKEITEEKKRRTGDGCFALD